MGHGTERYAIFVRVAVASAQPAQHGEFPNDHSAHQYRVGRAILETLEVTRVSALEKLLGGHWEPRLAQLSQGSHGCDPQEGFQLAPTGEARRLTIGDQELSHEGRCCRMGYVFDPMG